MRSYATLRHRPFREVAARTNEDRHPLEIVPFGKYGAGVWTGHPIGLVVVVGILIAGLVALPPWRWFFGASVVLGSAFAYFLWRSRQTKA
jgi:MFS family permease